jgi:hypothetical protein
MLSGKGKIRTSAFLNKNKGKRLWGSGAHQQLFLTSKLNTGEGSE